MTPSSNWWIGLMMISSTSNLQSGYMKILGMLKIYKQNIPYFRPHVSAY